MFKVKETPNLEIEGTIDDLLTVKNGVLSIQDNLKYEDGKWFYLGVDNKWYFIGYGGVPNFEVEEYIDNPIFTNVFESKEIQISDGVE